MSGAQQVQLRHVVEWRGNDIRHHVQRPAEGDALFAQLPYELYGKMDAQQKGGSGDEPSRTVIHRRLQLAPVEEYEARSSDKHRQGAQKAHTGYEKFFHAIVGVVDL